MKRNLTITIVAAAIALLAVCVPANVAAQAPVAARTPVAYQAATPLSASEVEALSLALQDEYKALATYQQVLADFGTVRPFTNIARAEEQHIAALTALFDAYGLKVPVNTWGDQVASYDSLSAACQVGVEAEVENAALYDRLLSMVTHEDVIAVFENLRDASQDNHLPAFERCASR